jgi:hypothetical protein
MHDPTAHSQPPTGYIVDAENVAEMARLIRQARTLTEHFGLLPGSVEAVENFQSFLKLLQPLLVHSGLTTEEEIEVLYSRMLAEMLADSFYAAAFFQRTWGIKPA